MKIFVIENNHRELSCAVQAIEKAGHEAVKCQSHDEWFLFEDRKPFPVEIPAGVDGVITDLMFHISPYRKTRPETPSGLLVVIEAISKKIPVVICTSGFEGDGDNHHSEAMSWIFDGFIMARRNDDCLPFGWEENKDWEVAVKLLEQLHAKQKEKEVAK